MRYAVVFDYSMQIYMVDTVPEGFAIPFEAVAVYNSFSQAAGHAARLNLK